MKKECLPSGLLALIHIVLLARTASALVAHSRDLRILQPRDTCAGREGLTTCGLDLPENFCCPTGSTCLRLNNTGAQQAALCCPSGSECNQLLPITCDTKFMDPNQFPDLPVHVSDTSIPLPTCGNACCPLGFECAGDGASCRMKDDTEATETINVATSSVTETPVSTSSTEMSTSTQASTTTMSSSNSASASATSSGTSSPLTAEPQKSDDKNTAGLVLAGLFPGLLLGAAITIGVLFLLKRRQQKQGYKSDTGSSVFGPPTPHDARAPKISEPIFQPGMSDRVVFKNKHTASGQTLPSLDTTGALFKPQYTNERETIDSATLVTSPSTAGKKVRTLDPPFETPTKRSRTARDRTPRDRTPTKSFFSRSSSRNSRRTTQETITMTMSPPRVPSTYQKSPVVKSQRTPEVRQTTYSDVYRAVGVSPSQYRGGRPSEDLPR